MTTIMTAPHFPASDPHDDLAATDHAAIAASHDSAFDEAFVPFYLCIHAFGDKRKIPGLEATFEGKPVEAKLAEGPRGTLIPPRWTAPLTRIEGQIRALVKTYCVGGGYDSQYAIYVERAPAFFEAFNALVAEHDAAATALADHLDEIKAEIREGWRDKIPDDAAYEQRLGRLLPATAAQLRARYEVEHRLVIRDGDEGAGRRIAGLAHGPIREWFELAHRRAIAHIAAQRREKYCVPIERLREGLVALQAQITNGIRVDSNTFASYEQTLILFEICADIIAPDLVATVRDLAAALSATRDEAARFASTGRPGGFTKVVKARQASLTAMIDKVVRDCEAAVADDAVAAQLGRVPRALQLRP